MFVDLVRLRLRLAHSHLLIRMQVNLIDDAHECGFARSRGNTPCRYNRVTDVAATNHASELPPPSGFVLGDKDQKAFPLLARPPMG